jgi:CPA2 family monovalent cation:H+ antiporter-2
MLSDPIVFRDLAYVFGAAVVGGGLAWLARQPLILGYVVGGILVSPLTPGPAVSDLHTFDVFAEIGVILLMFTIGAEFSLRDLLRVRRVAFVGGPLGILLSIGLGLGIGTALGWRPLQGVVVGIVVSVASTMVLARLLVDGGELQSRHGRVMIGITLVEDLAVVVLIVLMPALGALEPGRVGAVGLALLRAAAILAPFWLLAARVMPRILTWVARTRSPELFLLVTLAIALGTAALTQAVGLSLALGAFLAGLLVSESEYAHETLARVLSLRDAFVALFFVTLGALIDPRLVLGNLPLLGVMLGLVLVGKLVLWTAVVALFGYPLRTALLVGIGLTQIGEFSFVLVQSARAAGHVGADVYNATLATALLTILANAALFRLGPRWLEQAALARAARVAGPAEAPPPPRAVVCGFGRVGSAVGEALETFAVPYVVIETDPDVVRALRARGVPCLYGDAAHTRLLELAGVAGAPLVLVTLPDAEHARLVVARVRTLNPTATILARAHRRASQAGLRAAGATALVEPEAEAAAALIQHVARHLAVPHERLAAYLERLQDAMNPEGTVRPSEGGLPEVRNLELPDGDLAGLTLREARVRERFGVTVMAITRRDGATVVNPPADTALRAGDRLRVFGLPGQITALARAARGTEVQAGTDGLTSRGPQRCRD